MQCEYCDKQLAGEESEIPFEDNSGNIMCNDCYFEKKCAVCPICEEYFEMADCADGYYFVITKGAIESADVEYEGRPMIPGIYKATEWPMFFGNVLTGFEGFYDGTIELVKQADFNGEFFDEICRDCLKKEIENAKEMP